MLSHYATALPIHFCYNNINILQLFRPKEKIPSFQLHLKYFSGQQVGKLFLFFFLLYGISTKSLRKSLKIAFNIPEDFKKVWVGPKILVSVR